MIHMKFGSRLSYSVHNCKQTGSNPSNGHLGKYTLDKTNVRSKNG